MSNAPSTIQVGIISDTHGLLRREALKALQGADLIIHAGDVGKEEIVDKLETIAPVHAVRGNVDTAPWTRRLPVSTVVEVGDVVLYILHNIYDLTVDPNVAGFRMVVTGHTHDPAITERNGVIYLNPGSAGPRRFQMPVSMARVQVTDRDVECRIVELDVS